MSISAKNVKALRDSTGAGMMDCKKALTECDGDMGAAEKWLREQGIAKAAKRGGRVASEGSVGSYIHMGGKIGVLVEINSETDFVARGEDFQQFVRDVCLQICSTAPLAVSREDLDPQMVADEKAIYVKQAEESGKPENICAKIAEGRLNKWCQESCLVDQVFVKDSDKKISDLMTDLGAKVGENIQIRRFVRFQLGEGIEKKESNFAEEVAAELEKAKK
jgi:elongation factor Ts